MEEIKVLAFKNTPISEKESTCYYCTEVCGRVFGAISFKYDEDSFYIYNLSTNVDNRRQGYATQMLAYLENLGKASGKMVSCLSVDKKLLYLVDWYKSKGYIIYSSDDDYYAMIKYLK